MERRVGDWIDGFCSYMENTEPPKMYVMWCAISVIAAVLQRKCSIRFGMLTFYPNMYNILVGPSGIRKGTAMGPALDFLYDINVPLAAESTTREALIRALNEATNVSPDPESGVMGEQHASLTIFSPELTVFLGHKNYQLMSDLTDWYDCRRRWTYRTKGMGTDEIVGVYVNLVGATTPDLIRTELPLDAIGGGLTSRMIFVYEEKKGKDVPVTFLTDSQHVLHSDLLIDLQEIHMMRGRFSVTEGFVKMWIEWYMEQSKNPPFADKAFSGYLMRRPNHVMKLAMIVNASRTSKMVIEKRDLERAISILERTEVKMPYTFAGVGKYRHADTLEAVMQEIALRGTVTMGELTTIFRRDVSKIELQEILSVLDTMKFAKITRIVGTDEITIEHVRPKK